LEYPQESLILASLDKRKVTTMGIREKLPSGWWLILFFSITFSAVAWEHDLQLVDAAKAQKWVGVNVFLEAGKINVNTTQADGTSALAWAVYWDHGETTRLLLEAGSNPNIANENGVSPLILAIKNRSHTTVNALLEQGADPNATLWNGVTPLMIAASTGVTQVVESLLAHEADINAREPRRGQSALMWAISFAQPDAARVLIENGAEINARSKMLDVDGFTPMVLEGYYMANVTVTPRGGYTPLMFAARMGDLNTSKLLIERGADVNLLHEEEGSSLVIAAARGYEKLALYLLEQGAAPNTADANGMTALHYAMRDGLRVLHGFVISEEDQICGHGDKIVVSRFPIPCKPLELATDAELAMLKEQNPRLWIEKPKLDPNDPLPGNNMHELAEALLARGADPNARMKYQPPRLRFADDNYLSRLHWKGATPFFLATTSLDLDAMEILLEHGADPSNGTEINEELFVMQVSNPASDNQIIGNATPLMVAAGIGRTSEFSLNEEKRAIKAVEKLLGIGADINASTATGWTALHAAVFIGANNLVEFLVKNGAKLDMPTGCGLTPLDIANGEKTRGLDDDPIFRESTARLLSSLGANPRSLSDPVGHCVLAKGE